jgi:hypothetical protein
LIDDSPKKNMIIFHIYVSLPEGSLKYQQQNTQNAYVAHGSLVELGQIGSPRQYKSKMPNPTLQATAFFNWN